MRECIIAIVIAVFATMPVGAGSRTSECDWDWHASDEADNAYAACELRHNGARPAEWHRDKGDELIRVFLAHSIYVEPPIIVIELILPREGDGLAVVHDAHPGRHRSRSYAFGREKFEPLRAELLALRGRGAPLRGAKQELEYVGSKMCLDPSTAFFDAVIAGRVGRAVADYCNLDWKFAWDIAAFAASLDPDCKPIFDHDDPLLAFASCLRMQGDRRAASLAYRNATTLVNWSTDVNPGATEAQLLDPAVTMEMPGYGSRAGRDDAIETWKAATRTWNDWSCDVDTVKADQGIATVKGFCSRSADLSENRPVNMRSPFVLTWRVQADGSLRLTDWSFGPAERSEHTRGDWP